MNFSVCTVEYSDPRFEINDTEDEFAVTLEEVAPTERTRFTLLYDFGDGWEHEVVVEKIVPREHGQRLPCCLAGERSRPPEDCGGPWGYQDFLEAINDPKHEEHDSMLEWVGGHFDPEGFDLTALNKRLPNDIEFMAGWR